MGLIEFVLDINVNGSRQRVSARSPQGDAVADIDIPASIFDQREQLMASAVVRSRGPRNVTAAAPATAMQTKADLGRSLHAAIFVGDVAKLFAASKAIADVTGEPLRLCIHAHDPNLAGLPWELLRSRDGLVLAAADDTPIVRRVTIGGPATPVECELPLRVLVILANQTLQRLDLGVERAHIEGAFKDLIDAGSVYCEWLVDPTPNQISESLAKGAWNILHFAGHGGFDETAQEGHVAITGNDGEEKKLTAHGLGHLVRSCRSIRFVFLNSCDGALGSGDRVVSSTATVLAASGVPAVLAMQFPISDAAAASFAHAVYRALSHWSPIDRAVTIARRELLVEDSPEWATPVLYLRGDGRAWIPRPAPAVAPSPSPMSSPAPAPPPTRPLAWVFASLAFVPAAALAIALGARPNSASLVADGGNRVTIPPSTRAPEGNPSSTPYLSCDPVPKGTLFCTDFEGGEVASADWTTPLAVKGTNTFDTHVHRSGSRGYLATTEATTLAAMASVVRQLKTEAKTLAYSFSFYVENLGTDRDVIIARMGIGPRARQLDLVLDAKGIHVHQRAELTDGGSLEKDDLAKPSHPLGIWTQVTMTLERNAYPRESKIDVAFDGGDPHPIVALPGDYPADDIEISLGLLYVMPPSTGARVVYDDVVLRAY